MTTNIEQHLPIFVIGAGIAGISAAKKLHDSGKQVIVFEAKERIGGRIHSINHQQDVFDLGASWIHGIQNNPIYDFSQKLKIQTKVLNYDTAQYFHSNGEAFNEAQVIEFEKHIKKISQLLNEFTNNIQLNSQTEQFSINAEEALQRIIANLDFENLVFENLAIAEQDLKTYLYAYFKFAANDPYASELNQLAPDFLNFEGYCEGDEVIFPQGYFQVVDHLAQDLAIQTNVEIKQILIEDEHVKIIDQNNMTYLGAKVVIAVPLGVLKKQQIEFIPPLDEHYETSIKKSGFGSFNKVFFQLNTPLALNPNEHQHYNSHFYFYDDVCFNIFDLSHVYDKPCYLVMLGGEVSNWVDHASDEDVWSLIANRLEQLFHTRIARPSKLIVTRWGADPHTHGAFSYPALGQTIEHQYLWQKSIQNLIFFAGEHCHAQYPATVHGAYLSGLDTAKKILSDQ